MNKMETIGLAAVVVIAAAIIGFFSQRQLGPDNVVEEAAEEIIQEETGVKFDLTPKSKEE